MRDLLRLEASTDLGLRAAAARVLAVAAIAGAGAAGCGVVLGIHDIVPPPDGGEHDAEIDASNDASNDGTLADSRPEVDAGDACSDCAAPACTASAPVRSDGGCISVQELGRGSSDHECAVMSDGSVWCWGANENGQLGTGLAGAYAATPAPVAGLPPGVKVTHASLGNAATCVITTEGDVYCWGDSLAGGSSTNPVRVAIQGVATFVTVGPSDSCAVLQNGDVDCWGTNGASELGCDGDAGFDASYCMAGSGNNPGTVSIVRPVPFMQHTLQVSVSGDVSCAITGGTGWVTCVGDDSVGYLGDGKTYPHDVCCDFVPDVVVSAAPLTSIEATELYTCAKDNNSQYYCWGDNQSCAIYGQGCPSGINAVPTPTLIALPKPIAQLAPGWQHGCASVDNGNEVDCWGWNAHGELGIGLTGYGQVVTAATTVGSLIPPVADIAAHRHFTCAHETSGRVLCWGQNDRGQVGNGAAGNDVLTPTPVAWPQ